VASGTKGFTLDHDDLVKRASFSPDGNLVVTVGSGSAQIWEARTAMKRFTLDHHFVQSASFSPDGRYLLTASRNTARVWNLKTGAGYSREPIMHANIAAALFSADGKLVITGSGHPDRRGYGVERADNSVRFWDIETGKQQFIKQLKHNYEVMTVAFGPGRKFAVANSAARVGEGRYETLLEDSTVRLWNVALRDRRLMHTLEHNREVQSMSFSPDGTRLLTRAGDTVRLWDVKTGEEPITLSHDKDVAGVAFGPNGRLMVTASKDKTARLWDAQTGEQRFMVRQNSGVQDAWLIASGKLLATVSDRTLKVWRSKSGTAKDGDELFALPLKGYDKKVNADSFSPEGKLLAVVAGKTVEVWDVEKREKRFALDHEGQVRMAAFTANGKLLVTGSTENSARAWDLQSGQTQHTFGHADKINELSLSPDGRTVLTASDDGTARLWDVESGLERFTLRHEGGVRSARFLAEGRLAVTWSACDYQSLCETKVWDLETGEEHAALGVRNSRSMGFSQNGKLMFIAREFSRKQWMPRATVIEVWDVETAEERFAEPFEIDKRAGTIAFSPDGNYLAATAGNSVLIWAISGELLQSAIAAATRVCLSPEFRRHNLAESDVEAHENWKLCEQKHERIKAENQ